MAHIMIVMMIASDNINNSIRPEGMVHMGG